MKKNILIILLFSVLFSLDFYEMKAQSEDILLTNSKKIDKNRYRDIKGSPYFFEDWQKGKVISAEAEAIENVMLNYNGYTKGFEIKMNDRFIELDEKWYVRVIVEGAEEEIIFQRNFLPPFNGKFSRQVYKGKDITVLQEFNIKIAKKTINNVGKKVEFQRFIPVEQYYLIEGQKAKYFKLKKKNILAELGNSTKLEAFIKKEKMKLDSEADLKKLLTFYENGEQ